MHIYIIFYRFYERKKWSTLKGIGPQEYLFLRYLFFYNTCFWRLCHLQEVKCFVFVFPLIFIVTTVLMNFQWQISSLQVLFLSISFSSLLFLLKRKYSVLIYIYIYKCVCVCVRMCVCVCVCVCANITWVKCVIREQTSLLANFIEYNKKNLVFKVGGGL